MEFLRGLLRSNKVGLTTEWHRWLFPIRSLLPSLAFPASRSSIRSPFLLDPESTRRVVLLSSRSLIVAKKLYVGNLTYNVNESDLEALFSPFGTVQSAQIIVDRDTNRSKGFGFVEMGTDAEAQAAIQGLNERDHDGRNLTVNEAKPREPRRAAVAATAVVVAAATAAAVVAQRRRRWLRRRRRRRPLLIDALHRGIPRVAGSATRLPRWSIDRFRSDRVSNPGLLRFDGIDSGTPARIRGDGFASAPFVPAVHNRVASRASRGVISSWLLTGSPRDPGGPDECRTFNGGRPLAWSPRQFDGLESFDGKHQSSECHRGRGRRPHRHGPGRRGRRGSGCCP